MSDHDPWRDPQSASPTPTGKKGMSGCFLAAIIVGGLGVVCGLVCCGGLAYFGAMWIPTISKVPAEVTAVSRKILNVEMLPDFSPDESMTIDNMMITMRIAQFKQKEGKGSLVMGAVHIKFGDPNPGNDPSAQFRSKYEMDINDSLNIKKTETRDIMINDQKVSVSIGEGTDRNTGKTVHTAGADFDLPTGKTFFRIRLDDDVWNEEAVLKMLEDAKAP